METKYLPRNQNKSKTGHPKSSFHAPKGKNHHPSKEIVEAKSPLA